MTVSTSTSVVGVWRAPQWVTLATFTALTRGTALAAFGLMSAAAGIATDWVRHRRSLDRAGELLHAVLRRRRGFLCGMVLGSRLGGIWRLRSVCWVRRSRWRDSR